MRKEKFIEKKKSKREKEKVKVLCYTYILFLWKVGKLGRIMLYYTYVNIILQSKGKLLDKA